MPVFIHGGLFHWKENYRNRGVKDILEKDQKRGIAVFALAALIAAIIWGLEKQGILGGEVVVERNGYGEGVRVEELVVTIEGEVEREPIQVVIDEQEHQPEKIQEVLQKSIEQLEELIRGENDSLEHVDSALDLITKIPQLGVEVEWSFDRYDLLDISGQLQTDNLTEEGTPIELRALLKYKTAQAEHRFNARVYPPEKSGKETLLFQIEKEIKRINDKSKETKKIQLPKEYHGKKITWASRSSGLPQFILLLGLVGLCYFILHEKQERKNQLKKKNAQMQVDYPEIINQFVLLLGTGVTMQKAWFLIVSNYQKQKKKHGLRYAYEEMNYTSHELQSNMPEADCYERFGKRCQLPEYTKFGALLSQNLKKGASGLTQLLAVEADTAFEERKSRARKLGEEAGTKLLFPMFLMLGVVLIIVIVPAFLSFQL